MAGNASAIRLSSRAGPWLVDESRRVVVRHRPAEALRIVNVPSKEQLAEALTAFIHKWNETAHQCNGTTKSVAKVTAKCQSEHPKPLATAA